MIYVKTKYCTYAIVLPIAPVQRLFCGETLHFSIIARPEREQAN